MARYQLRYMFDWGAGVCLWAANDAARERFGYPIEAHALPLPEETRLRVMDMMRWYDSTEPWLSDDPSDAWPEADYQRFREAAQQLLALLREQLGPEYEVLDDSHTADAPTAAPESGA